MQEQARRQQTDMPQGRPGGMRKLSPGCGANFGVRKQAAMGIYEELDAAIQGLRESGRCELEQLTADVAISLVARLRATFFSGASRPWWHHFPTRRVSVVVEPSKTTARLADVIGIEPSAEVLLIPDPETVEPCRVYQGSLASVIESLGECYLFEYYLAAPDLSWVLAENDHNQLLFHQR